MLVWNTFAHFHWKISFKCVFLVSISLTLFLSPSLPCALIESIRKVHFVLLIALLLKDLTSSCTEVMSPLWGLEQKHRHYISDNRRQQGRTQQLFKNAKNNN